VKQKASLQIASSPREAWAGAIAPWFGEVLPVSWKQELSSVVVVPTRSHAHALKARLLQEGASHLGVQFVTPAGLRELLRGVHKPALPLREHLRLLLAVAAEQTLRESSEDDASADNLAAKAVVRAPDHLLRTLDRLETAGWEFASLGLDSSRLSSVSRNNYAPAVSPVSPSSIAICWRTPSPSRPFSRISSSAGLMPRTGRNGFSFEPEPSSPKARPSCSITRARIQRSTSAGSVRGRKLSVKPNRYPRVQKS
jgi:hypothetical protein